MENVHIFNLMLSASLSLRWFKRLGEVHGEELGDVRSGVLCNVHYRVVYRGKLKLQNVLCWVGLVVN